MTNPTTTPPPDDWNPSPEEWDRALQILHWGFTNLPDPPEVATARQARRDLLARIDADDRTATRDERRLRDRYSRIVDAHAVKVLAAYHHRT
jgi:hypothetical protein